MPAFVVFAGRLRTLSVAAGGEWLDGALFGMEYVTTPTTVRQMSCPMNHGLENSNLDEAVVSRHLDLNLDEAESWLTVGLYVQGRVLMVRNFD